MFRHISALSPVLTSALFGAELLDLHGISGSPAGLPLDTYCTVMGGGSIGGGHPPAPAFALTAAALTDVGLLREGNEDALAVHTDRNLFLAADGMGGHQAGQVASQVAVASIGLGFRPPPVLTNVERKEALRKALQAANKDILDLADLDPDLKGMGTTIVALHFHENWFYAAHAGDSRIYRIRRGGIHLLTRDHSLVNKLIEMGASAATVEAARKAHGNIITSGLGLSRNAQIDVAVGLVEAGDVYLLCTDGLSGVLSDEAVRDIILAAGSLEEACRTLIRRANEGGGPDNITALLVKAESV